VVFDRIREIRGKSADLTPTMINQAVNQTLSRTILTSSTVLLVTLILYIFGGEGVHAFAYAMLIGVLTGTYSSVFIAAPILLWFRRPAASAAVRSQTIGTLGTSRAATV
jgi:SecD/SecF fusion protein